MNYVAVGDTSHLEELKKVGKRSEQDNLMPAFIGAIENIDSLIGDTRTITRAAVAGKLDVRADSAKHKGVYRKIVEE